MLPEYLLATIPVLEWHGNLAFRLTFLLGQNQETLQGS